MELADQNCQIFACVCKEVTDTADPLSVCSEFVEIRQLSLGEIKLNRR